MLETKVCSKCKEEKLLEQFKKISKNKSYRYSTCRKCTNQENNNNYKHKAASNKRNQTYAKKHPEKLLLHGAKYRAKKKNLEFNLTIEDITIPEFCPILGIKLQSSLWKVSDTSPSIDRIDNNLGYLKSNIQIISLRANRLKNNASIEELRLLLKFLEQIDDNSKITST